MHKINWERFKGNVKQFIKERDKSFGQYVRPYVDDKAKPGGFSFSVKSSVAAGWAKVVLRPTDAERDILLKVMDAVLAYKDSVHFAQSLEGDFCAAEVNLAGRLERGEGLNAGDCQTIGGYEDWLAEEMEWEGQDGPKMPAIPKPLAEALGRFDTVDTIWNTLLC